MTRDIFLHTFHPVLPSHYLPQESTVEWILKAHKKNAQLKGEELSTEKLRRFCLQGNFIKTRYFECDDIDENWESHSVYHLTSKTPDGASIGKRNEFFSEKSQHVFSEIYADDVPDHLIHVTCTGYLSPSPAQVFYSKKSRTPSITHAYHMGCYASLPAVRMGMGLHLIQDERIDIVHTEMCSLHLDSGRHTPEQMVVQTLFADGHIKYSISHEKKGFRILKVKEKLVADSLSDMTWVPDAHGMRMTLSREVPFKIRDSLPEFIGDLCLESGCSLEELISKGIFAIHPGGPKIIEAVQKKLELSDGQIEMSQKVLFERGNMSSATLPHVWHEILKSEPEKGTKVLSLAFGPGLTIFGALFEVV